MNHTALDNAYALSGFILLVLILGFSLTVVITSVWVYFDASKLGVEKTGEKPKHWSGFNLDMGPLGWALCCLGIWIIAFPTYLVQRPKFLKKLRATPTSLPPLQPVVAHHVNPHELEQQLTKLARLKQDGIVTEDEFNQKKNQILGLKIPGAELVQLNDERQARDERIIEGNQPGPANRAALNPTGQRRALNAENPRTCAPGQCAQCGTINTGQDRFCAECGASLYDSCPSCKVENRVGIKFCGQCGADLIQHRRRIDLRRNALDLATQAGQLPLTEAVPLWREAIKTSNTLLAKFPGDSDGQATLKEAQAQLSSTLLRDAQDLIDQAIAMPAAPETARPLLNQAIAMLNQILVEIPDFEPARRAQVQAVDEERRRRAEIHAKHSEALQEASTQIQQGNHLTAQRLLNDADLYQKSYQEFSDLDYAKTNNDLATLQKAAGEVVSFAARLPGECEKLLRRFKESQEVSRQEEAKLELAALREEFNGRMTNVTTLSGSELELECRPHLDAAGTELDRIEVEIQSMAAAGAQKRRQKIILNAVIAMVVLIVLGSRFYEIQKRVALETKISAEKRLAWTGTGMRRAGFQEGQIKHTLTQGGTVVAWGYFKHISTVPTGLSSVVAIAAADRHTVALKSDGTVVAWGRNDQDQCNVPAGLKGVVAIAASGDHTVALKSDGTVIEWGGSSSSLKNVPNGLSGMTAIAAGIDHTVALKSDGTVIEWGRNSLDQSTVPTGLSSVVAIAAADGHTVALKSDGTVVAWGDNLWGQSTVPAGLKGVVAIAAGCNHTVALKQDGTVVDWGDNKLGHCNVPAGLKGVVAIAAGSQHTVALKRDGTVVAWGSNSDDQSTVPTNLKGVVAIAAGLGHTAVLKLE